MNDIDQSKFAQLTKWERTRKVLERQGPIPWWIRQEDRHHWLYGTKITCFVPTECYLCQLFASMHADWLMATLYKNGSDVFLDKIHVPNEKELLALWNQWMDQLQNWKSLNQPYYFARCRDCWSQIAYKRYDIQYNTKEKICDECIRNPARNDSKNQLLQEICQLLNEQLPKIVKNSQNDSQ